MGQRGEVVLGTDVPVQSQAVTCVMWQAGVWGILVQQAPVTACHVLALSLP